MSSPVSTEDQADFPAHQSMWVWYTKFVTRSIIGVIATVIIVGWLTGVL